MEREKSEEELLQAFDTLRQRVVELAGTDEKRRAVQRTFDRAGIRLRSLLEAALESRRKSEERYRLVVENANEAIVVAQDGFLKFVNPKASELLGYNEEKVAGKPFLEFIYPEDRQMVVERYETRLRGGQLPNVYPFRFLAKDGTTRWAEINAIAFSWDGRPATLNFLADITERKRVEDEREQLIHELQEALAKVKTLRGLIPICASCKKIRDDKGYWNQLETYIREHSEAEFSHSLCPDCAKQLYPEYYDEDSSSEADSS